MRDITVLTTASGAPAAPGFVRCLKSVTERKIRIVATDMRSDATIRQLSDAFYLVPAATAAGYLETLRDICIREKVDVLIPGMDYELLALAGRRAMFEEIGVVVSVAPRDVIELSNNKRTLYEFMRERGMSTPRFEVLRKFDEIDAACERLGYPDRPVCFKATLQSGSRGVRIVDAHRSRFRLFMEEKPDSMFVTLDDMKAILAEAEEFPDMIVMEYLPGEEYSVDILAEHGRVLYMGGRESKQVMASIPQLAVTRADKTAYAAVTALTEALKLDGNVDFDFKRDEEGNAVLLEINPRIAATLGVFAAAGMNLPYLRIKQLLGEKLPECSMREGVTMRRRYLDLYAAEDGTPIIM